MQNLDHCKNQVKLSFGQENILQKLYAIDSGPQNCDKTSVFPLFDILEMNVETLSSVLKK